MNSFLRKIKKISVITVITLAALSFGAVCGADIKELADNELLNDLNLCKEYIEDTKGCFEEAIFDIKFDKCLKERLNSTENQSDINLHVWQILIIRAKICYRLLGYEKEQDIPEKHKKIEYIENLCLNKNALQIAHNLENVTEEGMIKALANCNKFLCLLFCDDEYDNALKHYENLKLDEAEIALRRALMEVYYCSDSLKKDIFYLLYKVYSEKACLLDPNCETVEKETKVNNFCQKREALEAKVCENCLKGKAENFETSIFYSSSIECIKDLIQNTEDEEVRGKLYDYLYQIYILNSEIAFKLALEFLPDTTRKNNSLLDDVNIKYNMENAKEIEVKNAFSHDSGWNVFSFISESNYLSKKYTSFKESEDPTFLDEIEKTLRRASKIWPASEIGDFYLFLQEVYHWKALSIFKEVESIKQIREYYQEKDEFERLFARWISKKYRIGSIAWISISNTPDRYRWVGDRFAFESNETIEKAITAVENFTEGNARNFYIYLVQASKTLK